jgi:hypothetical protein
MQVRRANPKPPDGDGDVAETSDSMGKPQSYSPHNWTHLRINTIYEYRSDLHWYAYGLAKIVSGLERRFMVYSSKKGLQFWIPPATFRSRNSITLTGQTLEATVK